MIPYVEIIEPSNLKKITQIEPQECWFELSYYDVGQFEIYAQATARNLEALKRGRFVKIPNKKYIWFITAIKYTFNAEGVRMISATGYEAKYLLSKRIIQTPKELQGNIDTAVCKLVSENLGPLASKERKINGFYVFNNNFIGGDNNEILIDISQTQAPRGNLLEFVNNLLKTYNCGSNVYYENGRLMYKVLNGSVRNNVRFSQSLDNLLSSEYLEDDENQANYALVVSTVEEIDYLQEYPTTNAPTGIDRAEVLVSSNLSTKYEDANGVEQETTPTSALFKGWQTQEAKNELANRTTLIDVNGELDITNSLYEFDKHYFIGDMVKVQDDYFNYYFSTRILKITIKQDKTYGLEAEYGI